MKMRNRLILLILLSLFLVGGCAQLERVIIRGEEDEEGRVVDEKVPAPEITYVTITDNYRVRLEWTPKNTEDDLEADAFLIQYQKPDESTTWHTLVDEYIVNNSVYEYVSQNGEEFFDKGFGVYKFRMRAIAESTTETKVSVLSDTYLYDYYGYLKYWNTWTDYNIETQHFYLDGPTGMAVDNTKTKYPQNIKVYIADANNNQVVQLDLSGGLGDVCYPPISASINTEYLFDGPRDVAVGDRGYVYVADYNNNRVVMFDPHSDFDKESTMRWDKQFFNEQAAPAVLFGENESFYPSYIEYSESNNALYIVDEDQKRILKVTLKNDEVYGGQFLEAADLGGASHFSSISGLAVGNECLYICDGAVGGENKIYKFDKDLSVKLWAEPLTVSNGQPRAIVADLDPNAGYLVDSDIITEFIYVLVYEPNDNYKIMVFDSEGREVLMPENNQIGHWGKKGTEPGQFLSPYGLAYVDLSDCSEIDIEGSPLGLLLVSEQGVFNGLNFTNSQIQIFNEY
jgi:DNA-binding beta-propeller fold protein YncE